MHSKKIFTILGIILFLGATSLSQIHALSGFHRGPHPGDQHSGHADPKYHGTVKHPGDSTHHEMPYHDGEY